VDLKPIVQGGTKRLKTERGGCLSSLARQTGKSGTTCLWERFPERLAKQFFSGFLQQTFCLRAEVRDTPLPIQAGKSIGKTVRETCEMLDHA
jgi:hypothetical protein